MGYFSAGEIFGPTHSSFFPPAPGLRICGKQRCEYVALRLDAPGFYRDAPGPKESNTVVSACTAVASGSTAMPRRTRISRIFQLPPYDVPLSSHHTKRKQFN